MSVQRRYDGNLLKSLPAFRIINPFVMRGRNEAVVYISQEIMITGTLAFIRRFNRSLPREAPRLSLFHVILCALVRVFALRPQMNRFVIGQRIYQRNRIQISFIVKKKLTEDGDEANAKITFSPYETLSSIIEKINSNVKEARAEDGSITDREIEFFARFPRILLNMVVTVFKLLDHYGIAPKTMLEADPLYTSVFLANLGSLGMDAPYHHLYEWGTASVFVAVGRMRKRARLGLDGTTIVEDIMHVNHSFDDRISEGIYCARALDLFKGFIENPESLIEPPEIAAEVLREHQLVGYPVD